LFNTCNTPDGAQVGDCQSGSVIQRRHHGRRSDTLGCGERPRCGQQFQIPLDGRAVRARISRFPTMSDVVTDMAISNVYAKEI
jgi:hypothetical protein